MMSELDYDAPYNQGWGEGQTAEARYWDDLWRALLKAQAPWEQRSPGRGQFIRSMQRLSSVLDQDKRFWKLSAKHAIASLLSYIKEDGLLNLREDKDFSRVYTNKRLSVTYIEGMDWGFFCQLILHALLLALESLDEVIAEDLSRFDQLRRQADQVNGVVTYAHFIDRLHKLTWDDELIERVNGKSFVDATIAAAEGRARGLSLPDPDPDWRPFESRIRTAIGSGYVLIAPQPISD